MSDEIKEEFKYPNLRTLYSELCNSYRAIDDFRAKLLTLLPLATSGIFLLIIRPDQQEIVEKFLPLIGVFGFAIALGLFFFELYGIKKCTYLIRAGRKLEEKLGNIEGQFIRRAPGILGFIAEPMAAGIIYSAVLAAWAYLVFYHSEFACIVAIWVFTVGLLISIFFIFWLQNEDNPNRRPSTTEVSEKVGGTSSAD